MHIHIVPTGTNFKPIEKVLNKVSGIDRVYLLYTESPDDKTNHHSNNLDDDGSMNESFDNMPSKIDGVTNSSNHSTNNNDKEEMTSLEIAEKIKNNSIWGIDDVRLEKTDPFDFKKTVDIITDIYKREKGKGVKFSVNVTSGTKAMACAACYSCFFTGATMYYGGKKGGTIDETVKELEYTKPVDTSKFKPLTKDVLRYIYDKTNNGTDYVTSVEMSHSLYKNKIIDKQLIGHHVKKLERYGLIEEIKDHPNGREKALRITDLGRWSMPNL